MAIQYTPNQEYPYPEYDDQPFIDTFRDALLAIDEDMAGLQAIAGIAVTAWDHAVNYLVGDKVLDTDTLQMFVCNVAHKSAATGTFAEDRALHGSYWTSFGVPLVPRGAWAQATEYNVYDHVYDADQGISAICSIAHTSTATGTIRDDAANWLFIIDLAVILPSVAFPTLATRVDAEAAVISPTATAIRTSGFATEGDGGGATYFKTSGTTLGGFQSTDGAWWALDTGNDYNVRQYGAIGDGTGDDTTAIREAAEQFKTDVSVAPYGSTPLGKLLFPPGVYKISGSIDLQGLGGLLGGGVWEVDLTGAILLCTATGKTIFDCLGSRFGKFTGGLIVGDSTDSPAIAIQIGRLTVAVGPLHDGDSFHFDHVTITGKWSVACLYNLQGESEVFDHPFFYNDHTAGCALIIDGLHHISEVTDFTVPDAVVDTYASTIQHTIIGGEFWAAGGNPAIDIYGARQVHFYNSYAVSTAAAVRISFGVGATHLTDYWLDIHCEGITNNVLFQRLDATGQGVMSGFYLNDTASGATDTIVTLDATVSQLVLWDADIHTGASTIELFDQAIGVGVIYGGNIQGNNISWYPVGNVDITFGPTNIGPWGATNKISLGSILTAPRTWQLPIIDTDVPVGWEITISDRVGGISATSPLTIARNAASTDTINGATAFVLTSPYSSITLIAGAGGKWAIASEKHDALGLAWTAFTPTITASSGTFTTVSATGRYKRRGKSVDIQIKIIITTVGSAAAAVRATLPTDFGNAAADFLWTGAALGISGKQLRGYVASGAAIVTIVDYSGASAAASGEILVVSGTYEVV